MERTETMEYQKIIEAAEIFLHGRTMENNIFLIAAMPKDLREELRKADEAAQRAKKYGELETLAPFMRGLVSKEYTELVEIMEQLEAKEPTPEEIKHQLKYEKNPMRIKQLNRQLTQAYKKRKKER